MREPDLEARFTVDGVWWLPDRPSARLPGTLSLEGGRDIRLKLFGALGDTSAGLSGCLRRFPIILGTSDRGEPCTLSDGYEMGRSAEPARQTVTRTELCANRLYIGKHFPVAKDVQFTSMEVRFTDLERWLGWRPVKHSFATDGVEWRVEQPDLCRELFGFIDPVRSVTLSIWSRLSEVISMAKFGGDFKAYLRVAPPAPSSFDWFLDYLFDVRNLFTLFVGSPVYVEAMTGFGNEVEHAPDATCPEEISIYFNTMPWPKRDPVYPTDMPVTFQLIRERTEQVFQAWFSNVQRLRLPCELFFGALYNSQMYATSTFLNFVQALEVFHRATQPAKYVSEEQYEGYREALERAIPAEAPGKLRDKLEIVLRYGNERTLRDALRALIDSLDVGSRQRISTSLKGFVNKVVDTRNYLTHGDQSLKGKVLSDSSPEGLKEYIQVCRRLQAILTLHLLKFIGIPEAQVAFRVLRNL